MKKIISADETIELDFKNKQWMIIKDLSTNTTIGLTANEALEAAQLIIEQYGQKYSDEISRMSDSQYERLIFGGGINWRSLS